MVGDVAHDGGDAAVLNDLHNADGAVKIAFRAVDFRIAPAGVGDDGAVFHKVAADKAVGVVVDGTDFDFPGKEVHQGAADDALDCFEEPVIGVAGDIVKVFFTGVERGTGVGVSGGKNEVVEKFLSEFLNDERFQIFEKFCGNGAEFKGDKAAFGFAGLDDERFDIKVVIHTDIGAFVHVACQTDADGRSENFLGKTDFVHNKISLWLKKFT